ncbi:hypothetical protein bcere0018_33620 [Bacillus cereus Rock1-15]|uniref:hypothetical protein n=1 Tax=Bacillus cereus TaxID=1396 RepID=UPI0001A07C94|nr:hypothetical protein [Bacillus cereus]EEL27566.1 hypothetical protein bcere0018_33620 [Bacillus cereus Rock1-15]
MSLNFQEDRGASQIPLIKRLINELLEEHQLIEYVSRIFTVYSSNDDEDFSIEEMEEQIRRTFSTRKLKLSEGKVEELVEVLLEFYKLPPKQFEKRRADVLEGIIYTFGPFSSEIKEGDCKYYIEPLILDNEQAISELEKKCDVVFYAGDHKPLEFIECKANIQNVIPYCFENMRTTHKKKIVYLSECYTYLKEKYCEPNIIFACYNSNYERQIESLKSNGYEYMRIISTREIMGA